MLRLVSEQTPKNKGIRISMCVKETHLYLKFFRWIPLTRHLQTTSPPRNTRECIYQTQITLLSTISGRLLDLEAKLSRNLRRRVAARFRSEAKGVKIR